MYIYQGEDFLFYYEFVNHIEHYYSYILLLMILTRVVYF